MTVNCKVYEAEKKMFFSKHDYDYQCETTPMDEYGRYWKTYSFVDGAQWYEAMTPVVEKTEVVVKECIVKLEVKMMRTEYWSTEAGSKYYYEQW